MLPHLVNIWQGKTLWVPHPTDAYQTSLCYKVDSDVVEVECGKFKRDEVFPLNPETQDGVPDNTQVGSPLVSVFSCCFTPVIVPNLSDTERCRLVKCSCHSIGLFSFLFMLFFCGRHLTLNS